MVSALYAFKWSKTMTNNKDSSPAALADKSAKGQQDKQKQEKQDRLSQALRDNLFKRKAQARARAAHKSQTDNNQ